MSTGTTVAGSGTVTFLHPGLGTPREEARLRRLAQLTAAAGRLARQLRDQLVAGAVRTLDSDLESMILGCTTGPGPGPARLSAPQESLLRLAAATTPCPAADISPYRLIAALISHFSWDDGFGAGDVVRFEEVDFPPTLTHGPTRRFLSETGLPEDGHLIRLDTDIPLPTLPEYYEYGAEEHPDRFAAAVELPASASRLIRIGQLMEDTHLVVDGATGAVLCWSEPDRVLRPLGTDVATLAFTVRLLHHGEGLDSVIRALATSKTLAMSEHRPSGALYA
ncbi:hypothetical protein GCM10010129_14620 [Streptomyces fumigatiscleroticus]|nr:hypothetical protein GCM10010129_14620 [Streptomyces fumigatiscleroticus]